MVYLTTLQSLVQPQITLRCAKRAHKTVFITQCAGPFLLFHMSRARGVHVIYHLWVSVSQQRPCVGLTLPHPPYFQTFQSTSFVRSSDPEGSVADNGFLLSPSSLGGGSYIGRLAGAQGFLFLCIWTKLI